MGLGDYFKKAMDVASTLKDTLPEAERFFGHVKDARSAISDKLSGRAKDLFDAVADFAVDVIEVILLCWREVVNKFNGWLANHSEIEDKDKLAFVLQQKMANGNVRVVKGLFNNGAAQTIVEGDQTDAQKLDDEMVEIIGDEELVILT